MCASAADYLSKYNTFAAGLATRLAGSAVGVMLVTELSRIAVNVSIIAG
jgi:hypothetical protein